MSKEAVAPDAVRDFATVVTRADLSGLAFQHLALCRRRAWLHLRRVDYAHLDVRMQRGLALHDASRPRDRSVAGLIGLAPDRVDWQERRVFEAKGGAGAADAVGRQGAFYALMLWAAQGEPWAASAHLITLRTGCRPLRPIESVIPMRVQESAFRIAELINRYESVIPMRVQEA